MKLTEKTIRIACAMDDATHLTKEHFGSARFYFIYELDHRGTLTFVERVENTSVKEKIHGDPRKASSVSALLNGASVLLCCAMGRNVTRMRKKYCPVVTTGTDLIIALNMLKEQYYVLLEQVQRTPGVDRRIIRI